MPNRGFNVNDFRSKISERDILRTNKFLMEFTIPRGLVDVEGYENYTATVRDLEFWCEVSALPGMSLLTADGRRYGYGPIEKRPFSTGFTDISATFMSDANGEIWKFFNRWLRLVNASKTTDFGLFADTFEVNTGTEKTNMSSYEVSYRQEYVTDANLYVYNNKGEVAKKITFREMFPVGISDSELSWADVNSLLRLTVNLSYLDWYEDTASGV